jgi:hypothetical protein
MESSTESAKPEAPKDPSKRAWEVVLSTTPVVLTVVGTLLAGLSSSEMTLAQYHRSLAAQNQSKVGDQWAFFQAKRIRGQTLSAGVELQPVAVKPGAITPQLVETSASRVVQQLRRAAKEANRLQQALASASAGTDGLRSAAAGLRQSAEQALANAQQARAELAKELTKPDVSEAFAYLGSNTLPEVKEVPLDNDIINEVLRGIADRKPDSELSPMVLRISADDLNKAIDSAEGNARAFELAGKPVDRVFDRLGRLIARQTQAAAGVHQSVVALESALADVPEGDSKALAEVQTAAAGTVRADGAVRSAADELSGLTTAAHNDYTARRYEREARFNQKSAGLYEIEARRSGMVSDRHRARSKQFFYGMLIAQAGVTIASLALATRVKSVLWALAGLAGLTAVLFSGYVYLYM